MTLPPPVPVDELLDIGRSLIVQKQFDPEVVLELLDEISTADLGVQARGAVQHARIVALDVFGGNSQTAVARFALSRVIALLEAALADRGATPA